MKCSLTILEQASCKEGVERENVPRNMNYGLYSHAPFDTDMFEMLVSLG